MIRLLQFPKLRLLTSAVPMAVHVYCACGKNLKVGREMAGRVTLCPACGAHLKIPTVEPVRRGASRIGKADQAFSTPGYTSAHQPAVSLHKPFPDGAVTIMTEGLNREVQ
jgi:hypothetical protein